MRPIVDIEATQMTGGEKLARRLVFGSLLGGPLVTMSACGSDFTCEDRKTCSPPEGLAGSSSGQAGAAGSASGQHGGTAGSGSGKGGSAGSGAIGGDSGGESDGGTGGGDAGASTTGGSSSAGASDGGRGGTGGTAVGGDGGSNGHAGSEDAGVTCGNGKIELDEECDDGASANGPGKACNAACVENVCGDGDRGPDEGCDDGDENGLGLLRCAPDCSRVIEVKHITVGEPLVDDYLAPDPVAKADAACPSGYKALFAYGTDRRATTVPFESRNPIDWVLQPYTYYYNVYENPVWLTRDVPHYVATTSYTFVSNLNIDGTALSSNNCQGWHTMNHDDLKHVGWSFATDETFLDSELRQCGYQVNVYCIEQ